MGIEGVRRQTRVGEGSGDKADHLYFRGISASDSEVLEALAKRSMDRAWSRDQIEGALMGAEARACLMERLPSEGEAVHPVGFVLARRFGDLLEIDLVGVDPASRRRGVARRLLENLIEGERTLGMAEARLELAASNAAALALYEGLGFVVVGRRSRYYPDGDDALLLTKAFK